MSRTFTNKTSSTRREAPDSRGRGRAGAGIGRGQTSNQTPSKTQRPNPLSKGPGSREPKPKMDGKQEQESQSLEQRVEHRGAYSVISPNEKKRNEIAKQAAKETEAYEKYKQLAKPGYVSYVGTVGGGSLSENEVRKKAQIQQKQAKYNRLQKTQQWKDEKKQREESEIEKKKSEQRKKTEDMERRNAEREKGLREDHRRHNLAFFEKKFGQQQESLQQETQKEQLQKKSQIQSNPQKDPQLSVPSFNATQLSSLQKSKAHLGKSDNKTAASSIVGDSNHTGHPQAEAAGFDSDQESSDFDRLCALFPNHDQTCIKELLNDTGSVEAVAAILAE